METLNNIEKITLIVSASIVALINLSIAVDKVKMKVGIKRIAKLSLSAFLFMSSFYMKSQDTIHFKNKDMLSVKIFEVGISEIKYKRYDNLNGPVYLCSKTDIYIIKYENGVTDTIKSAPVVRSLTNGSTSYYVNPDGLRLSGNKIIYHNTRISDRELYLMVREQSPSETQVRLKKEFKKLNEYKLKEAALAPSLFVAGAVVHGYALSHLFDMSYNSSAQSNAISALFVGAALRISGHVVNIVYRNKKKSKRADIVNIYNGFE